MIGIPSPGSTAVTQTAKGGFYQRAPPKYCFYPHITNAKTVSYLLVISIGVAVIWSHGKIATIDTIENTFKSEKSFWPLLFFIERRKAQQLSK